MRCPHCQQENSPGAKFCNNCGARLELVCPACSHTNPLESRFCSECGQSLGHVTDTAAAARVAADTTPSGDPR